MTITNSLLVNHIFLKAALDFLRWFYLVTVNPGFYFIFSPKKLLISSLSIASATAINKKMKAWTKDIQLDHSQNVDTAGRLNKSTEPM